MRTRGPNKQRLLRVAGRAALPLAVLVCGWAAEAVAQEPVPVVRIEEDWFAVLNEPSNTIESPQFHTTMSPTGDLNSFYAQVTWNYRYALNTYGELQYVPGGLQLHSWRGDTELQRRNVSVAPLSTAAETIGWTQSLQTDGTILNFDILNGWSTTWGTFGRDMRISATAAFPDLSSYSTDVSVKNSWVTYGSNRVSFLMIYEVRYYGPSGELLSADTEPKVVVQPQ